MAIVTPSEQEIIVPDGASYDYVTDVCASADGSIVVYNAPFQDTDANGANSKTNSGAIYIKEGGNVQKIVPLEKHRHTSISITNDLLQSRSITTSPWVAAGTPTSAQDQAGLLGEANKAWTIGDDNAAGLEGYYQNISVTADTSTHGIVGYIRKDTDQTRFPEVQVIFPSGVRTTALQLNTQTGAYTLRQDDNGATVSVSLLSYAGRSWWQIKMAVPNTYSESTLRLAIAPAESATFGSAEATATGTIIIDGFHVQKNISSIDDLYGAVVETTTVAVTETQHQVFGHHVDISSDGKVIVASARGENFNTGAFYIITRPNGDSGWKVVKRVVPSWDFFGDRFGFSIGIGQNLNNSVQRLDDDEYLIAVGAPFYSSSYHEQGWAGVYTYNLSDNTVTAGGVLTVQSSGVSKKQGYSLEVSKDATRIVAAARESDNSGTVQLYEPHSTVGWETNRTPVFNYSGSANDYAGVANSSDPETFTYRPLALSPDGTWFAAGATGENSTVGTCRVWSGTSPYTLQTTYNGTASGKIFGGSVSLAEDYIVVGEQGWDVSANEGAYQYAEYTTSWGSLTRKTADTPITENYYGYDVFLTDDYVFTAASDYNNGAVLDVGAVYKDMYRDNDATVSATDTEAQKPVDYHILDGKKKKK